MDGQGFKEMRKQLKVKSFQSHERKNILKHLDLNMITMELKLV